MKLMSPGPSTCDPHVYQIMSKPLIHHRSHDFLNIYQRIVHNMRKIVQDPTSEIIIQNGSGSYGMEGTIKNLFHPHEKVLCIQTGYFSQRFSAMARMHQLDVICIYTPFGDTFHLEDIETALTLHPDIKGILVTHCETQTGALQDLASIGNLAHNYQVLFVVDSISGIIMNPLHMKHHHIDAVIMSSQKGFSIPPGLYMVALSEKAIKKMQTVCVNSYVFDYKLILKKYYDDTKINATPAISLYLALDYMLEKLLEHDISYWNRYYHNLHTVLCKGLTLLGYHLVSPCMSHSLAVCKTPPTKKASTIQKQLCDQFQIRIEGGLLDTSDRILRIGCMNYTTLQDIQDLLKALNEVTYGT